MEIDVTDYLSKEEMKELAREAFIVSAKIHFKTENNIKRIISNGAYDIVYKMVDESFNEDLKDIMTEKVKKIISGMSSNSIFSKPSAWDTETNKAYDHLQNCIKSHFPKIEITVKKLVEENIESQTMLYLKEDITETIHESIIELFKNS